MQANKLNVVVAYKVERKAFAKPQTLTEIKVRLGEEVVASRTIPGRWSQKQALGEFKRFPTRFTQIAPLDLAGVATCAAA